MSPDDLDRALGRWADATDPGHDPVTAAEVRAAASDTASANVDATPPGEPRHGRLPWLAVAAVLLLIVGGVTAWAIRDDGETRVATDPSVTTDAAAPLVPTQVVVEATDVSRAFGDTLARFAFTDADDEVLAAGPLFSGTSLVLDRSLPAGGLTFAYESWPCADGCPTDADGSPVGDDDPEPSTRCEIDLTVGPESGRHLLVVDGLATGPDACRLDASDDEPALTVAPGWSLRDPLPWTCGTGAWRSGALMGSPDQEADRAAWTCLVESSDGGEPVELPTSELQANDDVRRAWWRVTDDPRLPVEIIRDPGTLTAGAGASQAAGWTVERCERVVASPVPDATPPALAARCTPEEPLPLDLPALAEVGAPPPTSTTTTTDEAIPVMLRLVVEAEDLPIGEEGTINRWVLLADGDEVHSGLVHSGDDPEVVLAAEVEVDPDASLELVWEQYDCPGACPPVGLGGAPANPSTEPYDDCRVADVQRTAAEPVVLFRLEGMKCFVELAAEVPAFTVPPQWSLRDVYPSLCGEDWAAAVDDPLYPGSPSPSRDARECLLQQLRAGVATEMRSYERLADTSTRHIIFRVVPGRVELVRPGATALGVDWTRQVCTGLEEAPGPDWIRATGCGAEEVLPLTGP